MLNWISCVPSGAALLLTTLVVSVAPQNVGSIRGVVYDKDFGAAISGVQIKEVDSGKVFTTTDQGNYLLPDLAVGKYTLVFSKEGYVRQVRADVVVTGNQLTELDIYMPGDFTDMEEFVVEEDSVAGAGTEAGLLELRLESPALLDSVSIDLMSKAGASDAAGALRLVSGATVKDGKTAVIRGLPDRYVSSQLNGVRLPSADEDKRAVELDQFPSAVIESIQVSKTFTPDQQGDASGGAVDVRLRGIPDVTTLYLSGELSFNSLAYDENDFQTFPGGGLDFWGNGPDSRIQEENLGSHWTGPVGVGSGRSPQDSKFILGGGAKFDLNDDWRFGVFASAYHINDSSHYDDGRVDSYWLDPQEGGFVPKPSQGSTTGGDFKTSLYDVTRSTESVDWGGLGILGLETDGHRFGLTFLHAESAQSSATLSENTRGKEFYFPGHDPYDLTTPGHGDDLDASPYTRLETIEYLDRRTTSLQFNGTHELPFGETEVVDGALFGPVEFDWTFSLNSAELHSPDKRQFGSRWLPDREVAPGFVIPAAHYPFKPAATFSLGNLQRTWKDIEEESEQYSLALNWPFETETDGKGFLEAGYFEDSVDRSFNQDSYSNFGVPDTGNPGPWEEPWSAYFPGQNHPITKSDQDVDYDGSQDIRAFYGMLDVPLSEAVQLTTGARVETADVGIVNLPGAGAKWFPPGSLVGTTLNPGDADVNFQQSDFLPSVALAYEPLEELTFRASYSETLARQTFKELTPIIQQEFLGGPIFIGNPDLGTSSLKNYDLRMDYRPSVGSLFSVSLFHKDLEDPIEYVQRPSTEFLYTTARNYPEGYLSGLELEARQDLGELDEAFTGFGLGGNVTFLHSKVHLTQEEIDDFADPSTNTPLETREMTGAPEYILNLYCTYEIEATHSQFGLFYNIQGDTLQSGATIDDDNLVPSIYSKEIDSLNFSYKQGLGEFLTLTIKAKNLTDPKVETFYSSAYIPEDVTRSSYSKGIDYSISLGAKFTF